MTDDEIREALEDRNLAEVGRQIGLTRSYLNAIRNGLRMSDNVREKLIDYLKGNK